MFAMYRYMIIVAFAALSAAQNETVSSVSSVSASASSVASSASSAAGSASSAASSASSAASSASSAGSTSLASSYQSVASSASSVVSSASSIVSSASSAISSVKSSAATTTPTVAPVPVSTTSASQSASASSSSSSSLSSSSSSSSTESQTPTYVYTSSSIASVSYQETSFSTNTVVQTVAANGQTQQQTVYTQIQTTVPATTVYASTVVTSTESPTGIVGIQPDKAGSSGGSSGLSTGAKAGIGAGVGVAVVVAAILGALYAMRRRRRSHAIADSDRYPPSGHNSMLGGFGTGAAMGKTNSHYTDSQVHSAHSPPMREANPLDRYAIPGVASTQRGSLPPNSRTSDISSVSGSEPNAYRPGPGMPAVVEQQRYRDNVEELPEQNNAHLAPGAAYGAGGNPFQHEKHGGDTPSLYSDDGTHADPNPPHPDQRQVSPAALELSGENMSSNQGYRDIDPDQQYHPRQQLNKPEGRRFDPSHNF